MLVNNVNSRLLHGIERRDPYKLASNAGKSFIGSLVLGMGFTLTPDEREELISRNPGNAKRIFPYIGGEEVNTSPTHDFHRYVINFGQMSLEEAGQWPDLLQIVREQVKPERDKLRNNSDGLKYKKSWWQFGRVQKSLYEAIQGLPRCLVTVGTTAHICFSFQPTNRILSADLIIFPFDGYDYFSFLQSRVHSVWAALLSATLGVGQRYMPTDCFINFPFPSNLDSLETIGKELYESRANYMLTTNQGLTQIYNKLKDYTCSEPLIVKLRILHIMMDEAVLRAYGWSDIEVPPYEVKCQEFESEIIDRLYTLNIVRYKQEQRQLVLGD